MKIIHIDRENISSEEIRKFKDFKAILGNISDAGLPAKPFYRTIWFNSLAVISVISICLVIYFMSFLPKSAIMEIMPSTRTAFVSPPVPKWDLPYTQIAISRLSDTTITLITGSSVRFPANCLVDNSGNVVNENILIKIREITSPAEMFLTGIPMVYDSAGIKNIFESAGMIEIYASKNNKPLFINPQKPIEITLVSKDANPGFNLYYLDTTLRNWVYKGKDKLVVEPIPSNTKAVKPIAANPQPALLAQLVTTPEQPRKPEPPRAANPKKWHFTLDIVKGEFPELDIFSKTLFEIDETYKPLNKKHIQTTWEDVSLSQGNLPLTYFVKFKSNKDSCTYLARPVYPLKDYYAAKAVYDSSLIRYQNLLKKRNEVQVKQNKQVIRQDTTLYVENNEASVVTSYQIKRSFEIMQFGIWNCDQPRLVKNARKLNPEYSINDTAYQQTVYLADNKSNSLTTIYWGVDLQFDRKANNTLWMVTYDNRIAVFSGSDFNAIPQNLYRYKFNMRLIKKPVETAQDFIALYQSGFKE